MLSMPWFGEVGYSDQEQLLAWYLDAWLFEVGICEWIMAPMTPRHSQTGFKSGKGWKGEVVALRLRHPGGCLLLFKLLGFSI